MRFEIRIRWRAAIITCIGIGVIIGLFFVIQSCIQSLLGDNPKVIAALWFTRIWFGIGILVGTVVTRTYTSNADTEVWQMELIELDKRIGAYQAEKEKRQEEKKKYGVKSTSSEKSKTKEFPSRVKD